MKRRISDLIVPVLVLTIFGARPLLAQNANNPFLQQVHYTGQPINSTPQADTSVRLSKLLSEATEDTSQRTLYSSCYKTGTGQVIYQYSTQMLNYYNSKNELVPVRIELRSSTDGWVADKQPYPCYFHSDRSTGISTDDGSEIKFNIDSKVNDISYQQQLVSVIKSVVNLNLTSDIHKKISFLINGIETDYTIDRPIGNSIEVSENVDFPKGSVFRPDKKKGRLVNGMWQGDYVLLSADGKQLARFSVPLCYDAKKKGCLGLYRDEYKDGKHILYTVVPDKWLSQATYPITIDPSVNGPITHWPAALNIPSGNYPSYVTDSLLITIPGGITITRLYASFCFVTNVSRSIDILYGRIFFRTKCATTPTLQCDSNNAVLPGTCYLDTLGNNNDFGPQSFSPLTCCLNPSCSPQQFYFTVGLSRDCPTPCTPPNGPDSTNWLWSPAAPTPYPFYAYIVGNYDQVNSWSVNPTTVCSNKCDINLTVNASYGVPPYTITHPWASGPTVFGNSVSCNQSAGATTIPLTIPNCPAYCGKTTNLSVPPPIVYDACHDTVKGLTAKSITINPVPKITVSPDSLITCSNIPLDFKISSCVSGINVNWTGSDKTTGTDSLINYIPVDTINSQLKINYTAYSSYNGCTDSTHFYVKISKSPTLSVSRDTSILYGNSVSLTANSNTNSYNWYPATGLSCTNCADPIATPSLTTKYYVSVVGTDGCTWTDSVLINVTPQNIIIPNIFTPNGDGKNDIFFIQNLQFYPGSQLIVYDRWGTKVLDTPNYQNNWNGSGQSDGVYYYVLTLPTGKKYDGYLELLR